MLTQPCLGTRRYGPWWHRLPADFALALKRMATGAPRRHRRIEASTNACMNQRRLGLFAAKSAGGNLRKFLKAMKTLNYLIVLMAC